MTFTNVKKYASGTISKTELISLIEGLHSFRVSEMAMEFPSGLRKIRGRKVSRNGQESEEVRSSSSREAHPSEHSICNPHYFGNEA
ncbi:MAG TPA: hypothetical protein DEP53_15925 [Bacteroidetes bacterium]|nr:hypothetical protein [Bacteroidota bacterium]